MALAQKNRRFAGRLYQLAEDAEVRPKAVPTSLTLEITGDCWVKKLQITNNSGSNRTISAKDGSDNPIFMNAIVIGNGVTATFSDPDGVFASGGVKWQADASGCLGNILYQTAAS